MSATPSPARVREILDLALERPPRERPAFIDGVCAGDIWLRDEVVSLLGALESAGELLEPPQVAPPAHAAPLTGLTFGNYRVAERVGEGGMGVVYRAEDTRLGRTVAVKALPPALRGDPHRRARFEHEARILASLNHPNIAAIYGVEETPRGPVLVLEFVLGESLARRLERGTLPTDEALAVAVQVARALEAAHNAGVVHRDLKPANIQLSPDGGVKVLDFGVAKQTLPGPAPDVLQTFPGSIVGTAAYMSPEQARGRPVDRRTDLWALGCVLYEMLTGSRAFSGATGSDTVAAILRSEPDWSRLPADMPSAARRLLRRCLQKDPDLRQRDAGDAALDIDLRDEAPHSASAALRARPGLRAAVLALSALALGATAASIWMRAEPARPAPPVRFELLLKPEHGLRVTSGGALAISPDGRTIAFAAGSSDQSRLYSRRLDSLETIDIAGTENAVDPCFSPDGEWIAFRHFDQIRRVPAGGGGAEVLVVGGVSPGGLSWSEGGILYFSANGRSLNRWTADGSVRTIDVPGRNDTFLLHPEPLPGGAVCFTSVTVQPPEFSARVEVLRPDTGQRSVLVPDASGARFLPPNHVLFWQANAIKCVPIDLASLRLTRTPAVVAAPIAGGETLMARRFAVSAGNVLATLPGNVRYDLTRLAWFEPDATWTEIARGGPAIDSPRLSPDGAKVAMLIGAASGDVWVHDLQRGTRQRLTSGDFHHHPVWTRDARHVVFTRAPPDGPASLVRLLADGSGPIEVLWQAPPGAWLYPSDTLPDGRLLLSFEDGRDSIDLFTFDPRSGEPPARLLPVPGHRFGARLSPDGSMIAYTSVESGSMEVFIQRFPSLEGKVVVSSGGGYRPVWAAEGGTLFFRFVNRLLAVNTQVRGDSIIVSPIRIVHENLPDARFDVDRSGARFIMPRPSGDLGPQRRIEIVTGWSPPRP